MKFKTQHPWVSDWTPGWKFFIKLFVAVPIIIIDKILDGALLTVGAILVLRYTGVL